MFEGPSTRRLVGMGVSVTLLSLLVGWYSHHKERLQAADCALPTVFEDFFFSMVPDHESRAVADEWLKAFHISSVSFLWMQLAVFFAFLIEYEIGMQMYHMVVLGHVVKNFAKSFIASPRGFWFCTSGNARHCGSGFSLPSGHSMMSILVSLFLIYHSRSIAMALLAVCFELFIIFEIIYLGTHTRMDAIIGFSFGIAWFATYLCLENVWKRSRQEVKALRKTIEPEITLLCWSAVLMLVYFLENYEVQADAATAHPIEWQRNYQAYCQLAPGAAANKMRNSSAYEKSALVLGLALGDYFRQRLGIHGSRDYPTSLWKRVLRTILFLLIFTNTKQLCTQFFGREGMLKFLPFVVQALEVLVLFPLAAHITGFGTFLETKEEVVAEEEAARQLELEQIREAEAEAEAEKAREEERQKKRQVEDKDRMRQGMIHPDHPPQRVEGRPKQKIRPGSQR